MWSEVGLGLGDEMKKKLLEEYKAIGSVDTRQAAVAKTKGKKVIARSGAYGICGLPESGRRKHEQRDYV